MSNPHPPRFRRKDCRVSVTQCTLLDFGEFFPWSKKSMPGKGLGQVSQAPQNKDKSTRLPVLSARQLDKTGFAPPSNFVRRIFTN